MASLEDILKDRVKAELLKDRIHATLTDRQNSAPDPAMLDAEEGCWFWTGARQDHGRGSGVIRILGRLFTVQRAALWVYTGIDLFDTSFRVRHNLPTGGVCINPAHLVMVKRKRAMRRLVSA